MHNVHARVQIAGLAPRKNEMGEVDPRLSKRPAYAEASILLKIAPRDRKLAIAVKGTDSAKSQEQLLQRLAKFVEDYPQGEDTPDALMQLGMVSELMGRESLPY